MAGYMYGVRKDGSVVCINDLDDIEVGLRCECKCPQCNRDLQACALKSEAVSRYFRHNNEEYNREGISSLNGCTATSANESGLHMMAKELIAETRRIAFPPMTLALERFNLQFGENILSQLPQSISLYSDFVFECNDVVEVEKPYPQFRPDVSVSANGQTYLIEITVTHRIGAGKRELVENYGLPMLEIDLSSYVETGISREYLRKLISESLEHKRWICLSKELMDNTRKDLADRASAIQKHLDELAIQRKECFFPDNYTSTLSANRNDRVFDQYAKRELHFEATHEQYPFYIDIPITGEILFECDRRIWQGKIFDRWVYYRTSTAINILSIWDSLTKENHIPFNRTLAGKFSYPGSVGPAYLPYEVIRKYIDYLERLGFVETQGKWATVLEKNSLTAPNHEYSVHLESVLRQTDGQSPSATASIDQKLTAILRAEQERKAELERERLRIEAEQQRLKEEAEMKAAEVEREKRIEAVREAIQNANYDQSGDFVIIGGQRWLLCTKCNEPHMDHDMVMLGFPTMNKGMCRACSRR